MRPEWYRVYWNAAEGITALVLQSIAIIILVSSLIHFILFTILPKKNAKRKNQTLCVICFIFSILYCSSNLILHFIITFSMEVHCKYRSWTLLLLLTQRIFLYWFYIQRLKITFEDSVLRIRTTYIRILYISSFSTIFISAMFAYYFYTIKGCSDAAEILYIIPAFLLDIFWCLFLSIYFVLKLRQSIVEFQCNNENGTNSKIILLMCKLTNIVIWSSLVLQLSQWTVGWFTLWITACVTVNVVTACLALLFTFSPYSKLYEKYVCCLCHQCIIKWCKIEIDKSVRMITSSHDFKSKKELKIQQTNGDDTNTDEEKQHLKCETELVIHM